jgi:hypothetical protein
MYMSDLRHIHDQVILSLKMNGIFVYRPMRIKISARLRILFFWDIIPRHSIIGFLQFKGKTRSRNNIQTLSNVRNSYAVTESLTTLL